MKKLHHIEYISTEVTMSAIPEGLERKDYVLKTASSVTSEGSADGSKVTRRVRMQIIGYYGHDAYATEYRGSDENYARFIQEYYSRDIEYDSGSDCDAPWRIGQARESSRDNSRTRLTGRRYVMELFGVTATGESCTLHVEGFHPYFYVRTPDLKGILYRLERLGPKYRGLVETEVIHKRPYKGTYGDDFQEPYVRVKAANGSALKRALGILRRDYGRDSDNRLCLSNLDNWYKFIHGRNLKAAGWIEAVVGDCTRNRATTCLEFHCRYESLEPISPERLREIFPPESLGPTDSLTGHAVLGGLAPVMSMCYDIEATTDDGVFRSHDRPEEYPIQITMHYEWIGFWNTDQELRKRGLRRLPQILLTLKSCAKITREDRVRAMRESYLKRDSATFQEYLLEKLHPWYRMPPEALRKVGSITIDQVCEMIAEPVVIECESVADLMLRYSLIVRSMDHDVCTGYNIYNYDEQKLMREMLKACHVACEPSRPTGGSAETNTRSTRLWEACRYNFSRLVNKPATIYEERLSSSGMGENVIYFIDMCGRVVYDAMKLIQKGFKKYKMYSLDYTSHEELALHKVDFTTNDIIDNFRVGLPRNIWLIGVYCLHDAFVTQCLTNQLKHVTQNFSVCDMQYTPLRVIYTAGQGKPIFSLTVHDAVEDGKIPATLGVAPKVKYTGGTVLRMRRGFYPRPIFVLDFTSLFPNVIRDYNIGPDTIHPGVPGPEEMHKYQRLTYRLPGVPDEIVVYVIRPEFYRGVLPRMLDRLLAKRISVQNAAKEAKDPAEKEALDCIAGACKITNNSTYGTSADNKFKAYHEHVGPLTTNYAGVHLMMKAEYCARHTSRIIAEYLQEAKIYPEDVLTKLLDPNIPDRIVVDELHGITAHGYRGIGPIEMEYGDTDSIFPYMPELPGLPGDDEESPGHPHNMPPHVQVDPVTGQTRRAPPESRAWRPVMTVGGRRYIETTIAVAKRLEREYNQHLRDLGYRSLETKYEKVYMGALMFKKKNYASPKYEHDSVMKMYEVRGLPQVRRETPQIASVMLDGFMRRQVDGASMDEIAGFVRRVIDMLYAGEVDLENLTMTKKIKPREDLKKPESLAHIVLSWIMTERDAMTAPKINDRIRYVYQQIPDTFVNPISGRECKVPGEIVPKFKSKWYFTWDQKTRRLQGHKARGAVHVTERVDIDRMRWENVVCRIEGYDYVRDTGIPVDYDAYVAHDLLSRLARFARLSLSDPETIEFLRRCLGPARQNNFGNLAKYLKKDDDEDD
jgi:DNA polymerase elongation subunit (family B)